jgi:putative ABC transport system permease protein
MAVSKATENQAMLTNYLKIAFRNLVKNRLFSLINITGLALGMAAATLLMLNIQYGLSVDQFHTKMGAIYLAYTKGIINGNLDCGEGTAAPLGPALKSYPEVRTVARTMDDSRQFGYADKKIPAEGQVTDPAFLSMFTFPLVAGNARTALNNPSDIVITQQLAARLFDGRDPLNKTLTTPEGEQFTVTGVLMDLPHNTRFNFDYLLSWSRIRGAGEWNNESVNTWVELAPGANVNALNKQIEDIGKRNAGPQHPGVAVQTTFLYPFTKVYLAGRFVNGQPAGGNIDNLKMLGGLAAIILLIAAINFMNLSTARSEKRGKEVGIRKVVGAVRRSLVTQFIGESILMSLLAGMIALLLVQMAIPYFDNLAWVKLSIPWASPVFWCAAAAFIVFTGVLAGSYPAFYLSSFKPVKVLKGILQNGNALVKPRKILVVVQFVCSVVLINFTIIYQKQIRSELGREVGYAKDKLVFHPLTADLRRNYAAVKNELMSTGIAESVTQSSATVSRMNGRESGLKWAGMDPAANPGFALVMESGDFVRTMGLTLVAGRDIDLDTYPADTLACVINETSARVLGFKNPLGQVIMDVNERWKIVGVIKDFIVWGADEESQPVLIKGGVRQDYISLRIAGNRPFAENVVRASGILKKYNPAYITDLQFADKDYAWKFQQVRNTALLINTFTLIAIFVSCMGLLGLATYTAENRTREIGIRKILGASVTGVASLLTRDFVRLVLIAILIASPLAWFFMHAFLLHYSYRTSLDAWVLFVSGGIALLLALATIGFQTVRAAMASPVKSLRAE